MLVRDLTKTKNTARNFSKDLDGIEDKQKDAADLPDLRDRKPV
jgi:hypothetical protein